MKGYYQRMKLLKNKINNNLHLKRGNKLNKNKKMNRSFNNNTSLELLTIIT